MTCCHCHPSFVVDLEGHDGQRSFEDGLMMDAGSGTLKESQSHVRVEMNESL